MKLKPDSRGFSLIELMVVLVITGFLIGGGLAAYSKFNERQVILSSVSQLYTDLRFAQGKADSNEKPATCLQGELEGYQLKFLNSSDYVIEALCGGVEVDVGINKTLGAGVSLEGSSDNTVMFYILGKGAEAKSFCLTDTNKYYQITVSASGELVSVGLVTSC